MRRRLVLVAALALAGCGGGVWIGIGDDGDARPDVNLAVSPGSARAGETVRLIAAASDDFGIDRVEFFRIEPNGTSALLASDRFSPYQFDTIVPAGVSSVRYFARVTDDIGQQRDSETVSVTVLP